jgi:YD repeat-containing protein
MRRLFTLLTAPVVGLAVALFAGPVISGAFFLPMGIGNGPSLEIPEDQEPRHKGGVDLPTGLYTRENEDLVVPGSPGLVLRRTYLSGFRASKAFGVGATHNGEEFLIGDGERFQWVSLILATGASIDFKRISSGSSVLNALFEHVETTTEWQGAKVGWTGLNWTLRRADGLVLMFQGCGPETVCSIIQRRGAGFQSVYYRRNKAGRLERIDDGGNRWIALDYDAAGRIRRAHASTNREVIYVYDHRGRLERAATVGGPIMRYTYTDLDELATIEEPGTSIENIYRDGRVTRQFNRHPEEAPLIFDFDYVTEGRRVLKTTSLRSDGVLDEYDWDSAKRAVGERHGFSGQPQVSFTLQRSGPGGAVRRVTLGCPQAAGGMRDLSAEVGRGRSEDDVKMDLLRECFGPAAEGGT